MTYVLLNGALVPPAEALISVDDRSFRYGDGLFETVPVYGGVPYLWQRHEARLAGGLAALSLRYETNGLLAQALHLISANAVKDGVLRIHISRGIGSRGYLPHPSGAAPTLVMQTMARLPSLKKPVTLWLSEYEKISPRALPTQYKLAQGLASTLARLEASRHGCHDALQLGRGGFIAEAGSASIFWLKEGMLYTPALESGALAGITRRRLLELSVPTAREGLFDLRHLEQADAVAITNAASGAVAVNALLPLGLQWDSRTLAERLNLLRDKDIIHYRTHFRESLA